MTLLLAWLVSTSLWGALSLTRHADCLRRAGWLALGAAIVVLVSPAQIAAAALRRLGFGVAA